MTLKFLPYIYIYIQPISKPGWFTSPSSVTWVCNRPKTTDCHTNGLFTHQLTASWNMHKNTVLLTYNYSCTTCPRSDITERFWRMGPWKRISHTSTGSSFWKGTHHVHEQLRLELNMAFQLALGYQRCECHGMHNTLAMGTNDKLDITHQ